VAEANYIWTDPERLHGTPCFRGTRVPVKSLFDWLSYGETLDYFLENFPSVKREQALGVIELAGRALLSQPAASWAAA
jgi:uncharacterized protein (DUF433 family)